jgi:hypothetical protein
MGSNIIAPYAKTLARVIVEAFQLSAGSLKAVVIGGDKGRGLFILLLSFVSILFP